MCRYVQIQGRRTEEEALDVPAQLFIMKKFIKLYIERTRLKIIIQFKEHQLAYLKFENKFHDWFFKS